MDASDLAVISAVSVLGFVIIHIALFGFWMSMRNEIRECLIMDAGSAGVSPATPEGRIGYRQTIMSVRRKPAEARIYRGSQTT